MDVKANAVKSIQNTCGIISEQNLVMIIETLADMIVDSD